MAHSLRSSIVAGVAAVLVAAGAWLAIAWRPAVDASMVAAALPERLTDQEFWQLSQSSSEPNGTFHTENYVSNENRFQTVIPELIARTQGVRGAYVGVGPEQNFTYMVAARPDMAFIVDIRRGNLQEHLLYKALMELSADRAEFISRLFSRPRPPGLDAASTVGQLFTAFNETPPSERLFRTNLDAVLDLLLTRRRLPLDSGDRRMIEYIYRTAFFEGGPNVMYTRNDGVNAGRRPTYSELMQATDQAGRQRSFLVTEAGFLFLKNLQARNLVVPVVGDFGGPKALRAVGRYVRTHGAIVKTFYASNVETYLHRDGKWQAFCANVASMPLGAVSTFIRSQATGNREFVTMLGSMQADTRGCR